MRQTKMAERILNVVSKVANARIAVWGLAFKNGTDDVRCSPAMHIVEQMLKNNALLCVYDPKAMDNAKKIIGDKVKYAQDAYEACKDADILVILTEWEEFRNADLNKVRGQMKTHKILDLRNMLNVTEVKAAGFDYACIGMR